MKSSYQRKYHVQVEGKRTMVTIDYTLGSLFAFAKGIDDFKDDGQSPAFRAELQKLVDRDKIKTNVSQSLRSQMTMEIAQPELVAQLAGKSRRKKITQADLDLKLEN